MWKIAQRKDFKDIIPMSKALYHEMGSSLVMTDEQVMRTLDELEKNPIHGKAVILEVNGKIEGFAFLVVFWSNEYDGQICIIDELYVNPQHRNQGHGKDLIEMLKQRSVNWLGNIKALQLEVSHTNPRAEKLYIELGFKLAHNKFMRL